MASSQFPSAPLGFTTVAVSGQSDLVADAAADTLTVAAGTNITLTTNAGTDTLTIAASGGSPTIGNTQVAFGDGANTIGGDAEFTWNTSGKALTVDGTGGVGADTSLNVYRYNSANGGQVIYAEGDLLDAAAGQFKGIVVDVGNVNGVTVPELNGIFINGNYVSGAGSAVTTNIGLKIADETAGVTNYAIKTGAGLVSFGDDVQLADGKAIKTDTTTAHTALIQAYDVNGTAYKTFATLTNGNTPDFTIAPPSGGTVTVQASTFKSSDASTGITQDVTTGTLVGMTMVFKNGLLVDFHA